MKIMTTALAAAALTLSACASEGEQNPTGNEVEEVGGKLADAIGEDSRFGAAMEAAGLSAILDGPTPYTILVPSDAAFDALPEGSLPDASTDEGKEALAAILSNHILPGTILAEDISGALETGDGSASLPTYGAATLDVSGEGDAITVSAGGSSAKIVTADQRYDNGVVHEIDSVLLAE